MFGFTGKINNIMRRNRLNPTDISPFPQFLPDSNWKTPSLSDLPDLSLAKEIYNDLETYDPSLTDKGPGSIRRDGFVCGYAIGTEDAEWYLPVRHSSGNLPLDNVRRYIQDQNSRPLQPKIAAKGDYDREWMAWDGITTKGTWYDVQLAEALINEELETYTLDSLARRYLGEGKEEELLDDVATWWGTENSKKIMHLMEARHVGPYACGDIRKTRGVYHAQRPILDRDGMVGIYELESRLSTVVYLMRQRGVRMDEEKCRAMAREYRSKEDELYLRLRREYCGNRETNLLSGDEIASACRKLSLHDYPTTAAGSPSFKKEWLAAQDHPFFKGIHEWRELNTLRSKFLEGYFLSTLHKGRIHAQFTQTATEEGGARYGRFACRMPPLQQIPNRSANGKKLRTLFLPDEGTKWCKNDYSQQEYRMIVHYAMLLDLPGGKEAGQYYIDDPKADYHKIVAAMTGLGRGDAKNANFAKAYGAGIAKFALMTKKTFDEAKQIMDTYDAKVPFIKELSSICDSRAKTRGWIQTIGDRVLHFDRWEPKWSGNDEGGNRIKFKGVPIEQAREKWPGQQLKRSDTRKALNKLIQGGSGVQTKLAMLAVYETYGYVPYLQLHDELDYPVDGPEQGLQIKEIMENVVKLLVPCRVDMGMGMNWGEVE